MRHRTALLGAIALLIALALVGSAHAAPSPLYNVKATWGDTNLTPGDASASTAEGQFVVQVRNIGDAAGAANLTIEDRLPAGVIATAVHWPKGSGDYGLCTGVGTGTVTCEMPAALVTTDAGPPEDSGGTFSPASGYLSPIFIDVSVDPDAAGTGTNAATVSGGGAPAPVSDTDQIPFGATPAPFGLAPGSFFADFFDAAYPAGAPSRQASDRPFEYRVSFDIAARSGVNDEPGGDNTRYITSAGQLRTVEATLPRGAIGNPEALPKCDPTLFAEQGALLNATACPPNTQVGYLNVSINDGPSNYGLGTLAQDPGFINRVPLYNLEPPKGTPVDLAFNAGGLTQAHIYAALDPGHDYAVKSVTPNISSIVQVRGTEVTIWGVPGDPAHDRFRWYTEAQAGGVVLGAPFTAPIRPFFTNPMDCGFENGANRISIDSYEHPGQFTTPEESADPLNVTGCEDLRFHFEPEIALAPTDRHAGAPTGLDVHLEVPQRDDVVKDATELYAKNRDVQAIATPPIKKTVITLPEGMTISPSAAQGLGSCTSAQIGLGTDDPVSCPDNSQYGTLTLHTPILPENAPMHGFIYIAKQGDNPSGNFLSLYFVIEDPDRGLRVKIPGHVDLDPVTGQITTTFDDLPQFPVSDFQLTFKGGVRAALVNPSTCGTKTIRADFYSWHDPNTPVPVKNSYDVTQRPDGSPCFNSLGERPFKPQMEAGTLSNEAGSYSPFLLRLTRTDDDQEFSQLGLTLPPGLIGKPAGVTLCSPQGIAQAIARDGAGQGALEQADPSCPANSYVGSTQVGAGVGVPLTYVPGKAYLAGPYRGAPVSMVVISPLVVGPYDLGVIAVQSALNIDPKTAQASVRTDPFPQIFQGIPVRIRDIRVAVDRPEFILNPTSCEEMSIDAHITGTGGDVNTTADDTAADLSQRFQAANCGSLGFKPKLSFRLKGGTRRGSHPALTATLRPRRGDANIASLSVAFPKSEFLENAHIRTVCTRADFAASNCPAGSIYGKATAYTPLLDFPLEANVYLRSSSNLLPDIVPDFRGPPSQPIKFEAAGRVDSINGGIRNTFDFIPDAPITRVIFRLRGGKKGLLVNSRDICANTYRATVKYTAHNGATRTQRPKMVASCGKKGKKKGKAKRKGHRRGGSR